MMQTIARAILLGLLFVHPAWAQGGGAAQGYPNKTIRIIIPSAAGGPTDVLTRLIGQKMTESWGQPVITDNRPGGNTIIGAQAAAKSPPDGYTLFMALDSTLAMNSSLYARLPYDPQKDFVPVTRTAWSPIILIVDAATGPKSVKELLQRARANPGKLTYGSGNLPVRAAGELLKSLTGVDILNVPYKQSAGTVQGLLSKDVDFILDGVTAGIAHIRSGKFRALANLSSHPIDALPALPSVAAEANLPGFDVSVWLGLVAPASTPAEIVNKLQVEVVRILALPDVREKLTNVGLIPAGNTPAEFSAFIRTETDRWAKVIKQAGIRAE